MKVMIEMCKRELQEKRDILMSNDRMSTRAEYYPKSILIGSAKSLKSTIAEQIENYEQIERHEKKKGKSFLHTIQGSFRKLEID